MGPRAGALGQECGAGEARRNLAGSRQRRAAHALERRDRAGGRTFDDAHSRGDRNKHRVGHRRRYSAGHHRERWRDPVGGWRRVASSAGGDPIHNHRGCGRQEGAAQEVEGLDDSIRGRRVARAARERRGGAQLGARGGGPVAQGVVRRLVYAPRLAGQDRTHPVGVGPEMPGVGHREGETCGLDPEGAKRQRAGRDDPAEDQPRTGCPQESRDGARRDPRAGGAPSASVGGREEQRSGAGVPVGRLPCLVWPLEEADLCSEGGRRRRRG
mmetsp:Transcript_21955/g.63031  ORF Transcript_21955/g.63031 Transcript_21955/m.63031 type:complete len:270 (+) Transcript_21955:457-1266(+)